MPIARLADLADKTACPRLVVKVGSSLLVGREGLRRAWVEALVAEIAAARGRGLCTIAPKAGIIRLSNGLDVIAQFGMEDAPTCDIVIVTGGPGWEDQSRSSATLAYIRRVHASGKVASVCTGAMILAASGVLDDATATTKRSVVPPEISPLARMRGMYPRIDVREAPIVDTGTVVTGGGVSLCIDTTLHILAGMLGERVANETARILEYQRAREANGNAEAFLAG